MVDVEKLMVDVRSLSHEKLRAMQEEIGFILNGIDPSESELFQDLLPIDVPIDGYKDEETGVLRIRYPFVIGMRNTLSWKEFQVTQAAQESLLRIFYLSLEEDKKAGRIQPTKTKIQ